MTDEELAAIGTYVLRELNGTTTQVSPSKVAELRATPIEHVALRDLRRGTNTQ
jgi:hypothetical protein